MSLGDPGKPADDARPALPLDDMVVVAIEQAVAAPFATRQLGDLGARVIKIERPGGGDFARGYDEKVLGQSSFFVWLNRGKESVTADLKDPTDRNLVERLVAQADVFIQNLAPGAAQRLGLCADQLVAHFPRLIACDVSGYGEGGPYERKKAYDLLIQCETGLLSITGSPDAVAKTGISVADISGGMYAFSAILAALYRRERTGEGAALAVSLFDGLAEWMGHAAAYAHHTGDDPPRTGASHASIAPYGPFAVAGGREIFVGVQNEREWLAFCEQVLASPELASDPRFASNVDRVANAGELRDVIESVLRDRPAEEVERLLDAAGIAWARLRTARELYEHPQVRGRNRLRTIRTSAGRVPALLPPIAFPGTEPPMGDVPALGAHDRSVRSWLADVGAERV